MACLINRRTSWTTLKTAPSNSKVNKPIVCKLSQITAALTSLTELTDFRKYVPSVGYGAEEQASLCQIMQDTTRYCSIDTRIQQVHYDGN